MRLGLETMFKLDALFGAPSHAFKTIHVGGTNGKGSVSTKIAESLYLGGNKVGLYTSPHIATYRERIKVDGKMISQLDAERLLEDIFNKIESTNLTPTFFEVTTLLALLYFREQKVDVAVLEVGMGGRLDATNIITPLVSVITSISFDHSQHLGETLEKIAYEKGGIIKENIPVVLGKGASPFYAIPAHLVEGDFENFEEENRATAKLALELLPLEYSLEGLEKTPPCRFEVFGNVILDVAHNPAGLKALLDRVESRFPGRKITMLVALSKDKEIKACLEEIMPRISYLYLTEAKNGRAAKAATLASFLNDFKAFTIEPDLEKAFCEARKRSDLLIVTGTFYIMHEVRKALGIVEEADPFSVIY